MTKLVTLALCAAIDVAAPEGGEVPEWVHLLPMGKVETNDARGPYTVEDAHALIAASLQPGEKLVLDENHSTDLSAPKGGEAPARGWIIELQARSDGIWGKVEWTPKGRQLMADREYRGISPVIAYRARDKRVTAIRRASLVNQPNLQGLTSLHSEENSMDWKKKLIELFKLDESAGDDVVLTALQAAIGGNATVTALQSAQAETLASIARAVGLGESVEGVDADAIVTAINAIKSGAGDEDATITALQSEVLDLGQKLEALQTAGAKDKAVAFVDGAIAEGRVGIKPLRDRYIAMHMKDASGTEEIVAALPKVGGPIAHREAAKPSTEITDADKQAMALLGIDRESFKKARLAEAGEVEESA